MYLLRKEAQRLVLGQIFEPSIRGLLRFRRDRRESVYFGIDLRSFVAPGVTERVQVLLLADDRVEEGRDLGGKHDS